MPHQPTREPNRMDAFTDGAFSIVATLLVLDVKIPRIPEPHTQAELLSSLVHVLPSLVAFAFSFLTVVIYWLNHDHVSRLVTRYDTRSKYLNLLLLFCVCLIPFVTSFIAEYPRERVAVMAYGAVMLACALAANGIFRYLAFGSGLMREEADVARRRRYAWRIAGGPILYAIAVLAALASVRLAIAAYLAIPLLYVALPKAELWEEAG